jgi:alpha-galactosidase
LIDVTEDDRGWTWSLTADAAGPVRAESFAIDAGPAGDDPRIFRHGYQSWSPSAVARLGVDTDPSSLPAPSLVRGMHHADPDPVRDPYELRSEQVVVVRGAGAPIAFGFLGATEHDGTFRVRVRDGRIEVTVEAFLGGAHLAAGETRALHPVRRYEGGTASELLERWAADFGAAQSARVTAPYQVGWCSWYHWFHDITESALREQLALAGDWPFDVFQLDDGFQAAIGDWLDTNDKFPTAVDGIAASIRAAGRVAGIWIAPFLAGPTSEVATRHPDWLARHPATGDPLRGMVNGGWGGAVWTLDTTNPEVLAHLEHVGRSLVEAGYDYLKLDFTYAPSLPGAYADPSRTPAQRVRAGMDAVRRGAGDDAFILGCGLPIGQSVGVVDGMRIGPDVAPFWDVPATVWEGTGYGGVSPATVNAWRNTLSRSFMHRHLWLNDPDCLMLRDRETSLTPEQAERWAGAVGASGGMALVSDDLSLLDDRSRRILDDVLRAGRAADERARAGHPPRCADLLEADPPVTLQP